MAYLTTFNNKITEMEFHSNQIYHIYNRGNNKQPIFFKPENYLYFLEKVRRFILPHCEILSYCLMPNHFHFLIYADDRTVETKLISNRQRNVLSEGIRNLLQTYSKAINIQNSSTGSLFQQNTKAKCLTNGNIYYSETCFHYIHQNPMKAGLVVKMEDWIYSSFPDYSGFRSGTLCNRELGFELLDIDKEHFNTDSYKIINDSHINMIF